jgi:hypothetical protein
MNHFSRENSVSSFLTVFLPCLQVTSSESLSNGESNSFPSSELMGAVIVEPAIEAALGKVR